MRPVVPPGALVPRVRAIVPAAPGVGGLRGVRIIRIIRIIGVGGVLRGCHRFRHRFGACLL
ncbi:hypothetical protein, partial [Streptomyces calidiresistens]|uniref:hypothetical protein n=1 Tax=Streptomyces calidiresistens TaxID=1485586 RepID=UPI001E638B67